MKSSVLLTSVIFMLAGIYAGCVRTEKNEEGSVENKAQKKEEKQPVKLGEYAVMPGHYDIGESIVASKDGAYVVAATTRQKDRSYDDVWLIGIDKNGNKAWDSILHEKGEDALGRIMSTPDGGYIIAGSTFSTGAGMADGWLVKTDGKGEVQWKKTFGGTEIDRFEDICITKDGGFAALGFTESKGAGSRDLWMVKTDSSGNKQWEKTFGGKKQEEGYVIIQTGDGGYLAGGHTYSSGAGAADFWIIRTDASGNLKWKSVFGGENCETAYALLETDGGFIAAGTYGPKPGNMDAWIMKLDPNGKMLWEKKLDGGGDDSVRSIIATDKGTFAAAGQHGKLEEGSFKNFGWMAEFDAAGKPLWEKILGEKSEHFASLVKTADGYAACGHTFAKALKNNDVWVVKTDDKGSVIWEKTFGD